MRILALTIVLSLTSCSQIGLNRKSSEVWGEIDQKIMKSLERSYGPETNEEIFNLIGEVYDGKICKGLGDKVVDLKLCEQASKLSENIPLILASMSNFNNALTYRDTIQRDFKDKTRRQEEVYQGYLKSMKDGIAIYDKVYEILSADVLKNTEFPLKETSRKITDLFSPARRELLVSIMPVIENALTAKNKENEAKAQNIKRCESYEQSIDALHNEHKKWEDMIAHLKSPEDRTKFEKHLDSWGLRYRKALYDVKWKGCPSNKYE